MKITRKILIAIAIMFVILTLDLLLLINSVKATSIKDISQVDLYSTGNCGQLLKYKGVIVKTYYVEYTYNGTSYPAYCIDKELEGVSDGLSYSVTPSGVIDDINLWRTVVNGYPYKTIEELGVANKEEAFTATKQAIYCSLYENTPGDYEAIGEAGQRTLNALNQIVANAQSSTETITSPNVVIEADDENWTQDENNQKYVSKIYSFTSNVSCTEYNVDLEGDYPTGTIITSIDGIEKNNFSRADKFKIMIPIESLEKDGSFNINVETQVKTKPVIYGASSNSSWQNYALTGYMYEDATSNYLDSYEKNKTKIIIKKQDESTQEAIQGVEFELLDENKEVVYNNLVTDENGEIAIEGIMPGKYFLQEIKTVDGYQLDENLTEIEIGLNEEITVVVDNKKVEIIKPVEEVETIEETKILPVTGM